MKTSLVTLAFASTALAARNVSLPNGWYTIPHGTKISHDTFHGEPRYLTWMADSQMKHGSNPTHDYFVSTLLSGIKMAYDRTQDDKYAAYIENHVNIQLYPAWDGSILAYNNSNSIDDVRFGHTFLDMYNMSGGVEIYKTAAQTLRDQIDRSGRTPDGGFYHRFPTYIDQMWLDGIYMMDVFYARWTHEFEPTNNTAWDDIALQFDLIDAGTLVDRNRTDGLPVHGFDVSKTQVWADPETGAAPHVWGRAVGWYFMALLDTLDYFPEQHAGRARLLSYLHSLADAVVASQDQTYGGWYNVMTPGTESQSGNYIESSGSAMFVYSLFKSLRLGYLSGEKYEDTATSGWELMTSDFARERLDGALAWEWTVQVGSLSSNGTFEYYSSIPTYENDLKGVSPFLFSAYEYELYVEGKN